MMTAPPNMEVMTEQPTVEGTPEPELAQEPPKGSLTGPTLSEQKC